MKNMKKVEKKTYLLSKKKYDKCEKIWKKYDNVLNISLLNITNYY